MVIDLLTKYITDNNLNDSMYITASRASAFMYDVFLSTYKGSYCIFIVYESDSDNDIYEKFKEAVEEVSYRDVFNTEV